VRAYEFIIENATTGGTSSGSVATVVMPQVTSKKGETFFGGDLDDQPEYGDTVAVIRRPSPTADTTNK